MNNMMMSAAPFPGFFPPEIVRQVPINAEMDNSVNNSNGSFYPHNDWQNNINHNIYNSRSFYNQSRYNNHSHSHQRANTENNFQYDVSLNQQAADVKQFVPLAVARNFQHVRKQKFNP